MRIVFAGTPAFAVPCLRALVTGGHEVALVVSQPDKPAGRGGQLSAPAVKVAAVDLYDSSLSEAFPPMSVTVRLEDDLDVSRGDMICRPQNAPTPSQDIDAMIAWMVPEPLRPKRTCKGMWKTSPLDWLEH